MLPFIVWFIVDFCIVYFNSIYLVFRRVNVSSVFTIFFRYNISNCIYIKGFASFNLLLKMPVLRGGGDDNIYIIVMVLLYFVYSFLGEILLFLLIKLK